MNCPKCDRVVSKVERVCPHCSHELDQAGSAQSRPASRSVVKAIIVILVVLIVGALGSLVVLWSQLRADVSAFAPAIEPDAQSREPSRLLPGSQGASALPIVLEDQATNTSSPLDRIQPPGGFAITASFGDLGPQLLEVGAINYGRFVQLYEQAGQPLTEAQIAILQKGSDAPVVFTRDNAYFLLNFFWAVGLANKNLVLEEGPIMHYGEGEVGRFASTGGWTLGTRSATDFYSSASLIPLTAEQQSQLEEVAQAVYRPCCNNPTAFPDCNHGMAMLGLLELMASTDATVGEMFEAAKYANAYWFPQQTLELAAYFEANEGVPFAKLDGRQTTGPDFFSASGFQNVHRWLADNGLLEQAPGQGGSCGV